MTIDLNALWFLLLGTAIIGSARALLQRLEKIDSELGSLGRDMIKIKTTLKMQEHSDP